MLIKCKYYCCQFEKDSGEEVLSMCTLIGTLDKEKDYEGNHFHNLCPLRAERCKEIGVKHYE